MRVVGLIIKGTLLAYLVIFAVANSGVISIKTTPFTSVENIPIYLFTLVLLFLGFFIGVAMMLAERLSVGSNIRKLKKELAEAHSEVTRLKNITLTQSETAAVSKETAVSASEPLSGQNSDIKDVLR